MLAFFQDTARKMKTHPGSNIIKKKMKMITGSVQMYKSLQIKLKLV